MAAHSALYPPAPFPMELVDLILSFLPANDFHTLASCNIVCHQWYLFARARLFRTIIFKPTEDSAWNTADSFLELLRADSSPGLESLSVLVKNLTLVVNPPPTQYGEESLPHILPLLTNLTSLTISGYARLVDIPRAIATSMRVTMSRVKRIELDCLEFSSDVFEVFDLFAQPHHLHHPTIMPMSPPAHSLNLRELVLHNILPYSFMPESYDAATFSCPRSSAYLHTLSLTLNSLVMRAAFTALLQSRTPVRLSQIVSLTMHTTAFNTQSVKDILVEMPGLQYFGYSPGYLKPSMDHYLAFETSPGRGIPHVSLASTIMGEPPLQANETMRWWMQQLQHPSAAFVGVRKLDLDIEEISFDSTDTLWAELDQMLAFNSDVSTTYTQGAGGLFESVRITIPRVAANAVRRLFPIINAKGVLQV